MLILNIPQFKIGIPVIPKEMEEFINFVTKRGLCVGKNSKISWTQVETGSSITWKYPSCILVGDNSQGEFYSVALTNNYQQTDTGNKNDSRRKKYSKSNSFKRYFMREILKIHIGDL